VSIRNCRLLQLSVTKRQPVVMGRTCAAGDICCVHHVRVTSVGCRSSGHPRTGANVCCRYGWLVPCMICRTRAPKQRQGWSHNASYGRACGRIAAPGHVLVSPASDIMKCILHIVTNMYRSYDRNSGALRVSGCVSNSHSYF
jgi:hypothetical protein